MLTLTVTLDEKGNSVKIHGHGSRTTDGEKGAASAIASNIQELMAEHGNASFKSDVKPTVASTPEADILSLEQLLGIPAGE